MAEAPKLDPKYKGTKTYRLTEFFYSQGRLYEAGELITVTDKVPGRTWELVEEEKPAPAKAPPPPPPAK